LNFQTARFHKGNDLPYLLFLPTYAATAWYHGVIGGDLSALLREAEEFALGEYATLLGKGDRLTDRERGRLAARLSRLTGLSRAYVEQSGFRIEIHRFCKELLRDQRRTVGRLDSRFTGIDLHVVAERPEHDPSMSALMPPYTALFNHYVRAALGYKTDLAYEIFGGIKKPWDWGSAGEGHPDTSEALRKAMSKNPHMRVYVASGYYDLATPYFATEYTLSHMGLDPTLRGNVTTGEYEAGHMMYIHEPSLAKLKDEVGRFIAG
jgi:carboxypeptidase C (cathepsin A)